MNNNYVLFADTDTDITPNVAKEYGYHLISMPYTINGKDILYVHFSRAMSGSFAQMDLAIKELKALYPDRKIYTIDTKGITICAYAIVREVGDQYLQNK